MAPVEAPVSSFLKFLAYMVSLIGFGLVIFAAVLISNHRATKGHLLLALLVLGVGILFVFSVSKRR
jgi:hypothetical protein